MGRKAKAIEDVLAKFRSVHGDRYDYSRVDYVASSKKVEIICRKHGSFFQVAGDHARKQGCMKCSREELHESNTLTTDEFIKRSKLSHGDKYDYTKSVYTQSKYSVVVGCPIHGDFRVKSGEHVKGRGCKKCSVDIWREKVKYSTSEFISKSIELHGDTYDYSEVDYVGALIKVKIICRMHGPFMQQPTKHFRGLGCVKCLRESQRLESEQSFRDKASSVHGDTYDYSLVKFSNTNSPVKIVCKIHGEFSQKPMKHIIGHGCPVCCESNGERAVRLSLENAKVEYIRQWRHPECRASKPLPFDFYVPTINTLIEFDGPQHFGIDWRKKHHFNFEMIQKHDSIKNQWAKDSGIPLVRIPYTQLNDIPAIVGGLVQPSSPF